jgi:hypothetical protein
MAWGPLALLLPLLLLHPHHLTGLERSALQLLLVLLALPNVALLLVLQATLQVLDQHQVRLAVLVLRLLQAGGSKAALYLPPSQCC